MNDMTLLQRLFGKPDRGTAPLLYAAIVERARAPHWYIEGQVPDTVDGRFDMVAAILSLVLLRLEGEPLGVEPSTALAEVFIDDMDGQLREIGIGDVVVGKHVGRMMGMLGGRLGAYRAGLAEGDLEAALARNVYRGNPPGDAALKHVEDRLCAFCAALKATPVTTIVEGELPQ
jgi:cytochrome b pre-mRNA-processing protein 3